MKAIKELAKQHGIEENLIVDTRTGVKSEVKKRKRIVNVPNDNQKEN